MNNKTDRTKGGAQETLYARSLTAHTTEKKRKGLFLLMDLLLLVCIVSALFFLILVFTPLRLGSDTENRQIVYTVELAGVDQKFVSLLKKGEEIKDANGAVIGTVAEISIRPYEAYISLPTAEIDEGLEKYVVRKETNEDWNTVTVTVRVDADYKSGEGYTVKGRRIAVGAEYELNFPSYAGKGVCLSLEQIAREDGEQ